MCTTCGCGHQEMSHEEMHRLGIAHGHGKTVDIAVEQDILSENNRIAGQNRNIWNTTGCWAINLVSSPGSGKTTLLESTIKRLGGRDFHKIAVIEGDQHTDNDAGRIRNLGIPAIQINTHNGCHLDARMVSSAFDELAVKDTLLFIENVGNLVCPAMFDLGENLRVVLLSVTEGDDKPLKYPYMFAGARVMVDRVKPLAVCGVCGESFSPVSLYASCPKCGSYKTRLVSGQEFRLTSLIVETDK